MIVVGVDVGLIERKQHERHGGCAAYRRSRSLRNLDCGTSREGHTMSSPDRLSNPDPGKSSGAEPSLQRKITWTGAFWVASGVPALVLFSIGAVAATVGRPAWLVWTVSILFGFLQAFTYAEIAGLFPGKSGGASIYGAVAWVRYCKVLAPVSVWCNWLAWSPVLAIGSGLTAGYILLALFPADSSVHTWSMVLLDLGFLKDGLNIRINATFL